MKSSTVASKFLPLKGVHLCYCETIEKERGHGYYPLLLKYIQSDVKKSLYMVVKESNTASIKGIEKAGFVKYASGRKLTNGHFVIEE